MLVSVDELLGHAKKREEKKKFKVYITELDREIECVPVTRKEYLEVVMENKQDIDSEFIYLACPVFHDDKLIKSLKCEMNPVEVVDKILSASTIYALAQTILENSDIEFNSTSKYVKLMDDDIKN